MGQSSATQIFTATNNGTANAIVQNPTILGSAAFTSPGGSCEGSIAPLAPNGAGFCSESILFAPALNGALTGGLAFFDNAPDTPQLVGLSGTGTGTHTLTITPATVVPGYVGIQYPTGTTSQNFSSPNASGGLTLNLCATLPSGQPSTVCCPPGSESLGPCPTGLLPANINWIQPELVGTPVAGSVGTYLFTIVASDANGDTGFQNYTLVINPAFTTTLTLNPTTVVGGTTSTATVTLSAPAPIGERFRVAFESTITTVVPVAGAQIAANQTTATAPVTTNTVTTSTQVTITTDFGGTAGTPVVVLTVNPAGLPTSATAAAVLTQSISVRTNCDVYSDSHQQRQRANRNRNFPRRYKNTWYRHATADRWRRDFPNLFIGSATRRRRPLDHGLLQRKRDSCSQHLITRRTDNRC